MAERRGVSRVVSSLLRARRPFRSGWARGGAFCLLCRVVDCAVARLLFLCYREYLCRFSRVLAGVRGLGEEEVRGLYSGEPLIEVSRDGVGILSDTILRED